MDIRRYPRASYITPCVTCLKADGSVDLKAQEKVYDHLIGGGMDGVLVLGSMGEFFTLTEAERRETAEHAVSYIHGRMRVLIGTASMNTAETLRLSRHALEKGADAVAVISPWYLKLAPEDLFRFYDGLAPQIPGKLMLYNYPDRTVHDIDAGLALRLRRRHDNIIGLKDSARSAEHTVDVVRTVQAEYPDFEVFCGYDNFMPDVIRAGGDGAIGGLSNIMPTLLRDWVRAFRDGDEAAQQACAKRVDALMPIYNLDTVFIPNVKGAMAEAGVDIPTRVSFPLAECGAEKRKEIRKFLEKAKA